jgi:hypothetical protein
VVSAERVSPAKVHEELERARRDLHALVERSAPDELGHRTVGTRWTNGQMLFHMLLGYLVVRTLLRLVRTMGRLPDAVSLAFAAVLNAGSRPFHVVNYLGGCGGALVFHGTRLTRQMDRTIAALHRHLDAETDLALSRGMHFPVGWDPMFKETMTLLDVYHYGTQHYDFHRQQLTLEESKRRG